METQPSSPRAHYQQKHDANYTPNIPTRKHQNTIKSIKFFEKKRSSIGQRVPFGEPRAPKGLHGQVRITWDGS